MPRTTKDVEKEDITKKKTETKKASTTKKKKTTTTTKSTSKTASKKTTKIPEVKKEEKEKTNKTPTKKTSASKTSSTKKSTGTSTKKKTTKASTSKTATKLTTTKRKSSTKAKKLEANVVAEYYDLPYRYNETVVKILYQTPNILFVYWDISNEDRENFINEYGKNFFYNTRPILKIFNLTKDYSFEVEINDFANSWYIDVNDANCDYRVELTRKTIKYEENLNKDYIYVTSSNNIEFPNDRILLDELPNTIRFKNIKTNAVTTKNINTMRLIGINKIYNVHSFYKKFYKDEILKEFNSANIINPSSSSWK